ncbi:MAG: glycosyltransferase, partial [Planctomycetales bacterium]|nr:glycosyltransferase [Planctomycetales bacterium]
HDRSSMGVPARAASGVDDRSMGVLARAALRSTEAPATSANDTFDTSASGADTNVDGAAEPQEPNCVFVGVLDYYPNIEGITWFCREVWPAVRRAIPEATLSIVGRHPTPRVAELGELPGVTVVGEVPDVRPYLSRAAAAIAPLQIARGVQNKVLEAMSAGTPVIATAEALTGLQAEPDQDALLGVDAGDWQAKLIQLLTDSQLRQELSACGRAYVESHHAWEQRLAPFAELLNLPERAPGSFASPNVAASASR